jgi:hypothetical protein
MFRRRNHCGVPSAIDSSAKSKPANTVGFDFHTRVVYLNEPCPRARISTPEQR